MMFCEFLRREILRPFHRIPRPCGMITLCGLFHCIFMAQYAVVRGWFGDHRHFIMFFSHSFLTIHWFVTIKALDSPTRMFAVMILLYNSRVLFLMAFYTLFTRALSYGA